MHDMIVINLILHRAISYRITDHISQCIVSHDITLYVYMRIAISAYISQNAPQPWLNYIYVHTSSSIARMYLDHDFPLNDLMFSLGIKLAYIVMPINQRV